MLEVSKLLTYSGDNFILSENERVPLLISLERGG